MTEPIHHIIQKLKRKYQLIRFGETLCLSFASYLIAYGICYLLPFDERLKIAMATTLSIMVFIGRSQQLRLFKISDERIIRYLNQQYAALEESADLLLKDESQLHSLQLLQRSRVIHHFDSVQPHVVFPNKIKQGLIVLIIALAVNLTLTSLVEPPATAPHSNFHKKENSLTGKKTSAPAALEALAISIMPPLYTTIPLFVSTDFNVSVPEGSSLTWKITFSDTITHTCLVFAGADSVTMSSATANMFTAEKEFAKSTFYQLIWKEPNGGWNRSDYYSLNVIADQAPKISVGNHAQFTSLKYTDKPVVKVSASMSDDYGLREAFIIATVSKGSGESVKFREEKLVFSSPASIAGKKVRGQREIDLLKLGMEPGDELYFYVEASDYRAPLPNRSRTETFFVALQDTTREELSVEAGLGVDLMPEYFRSQRQIIIDSEKLLRDKKSISKQAFNARSNELGYDQKVLRLRYGEFLGEEFASGIGPQGEAPGENHEGEESDVVKQFGHAHDTDNEHNLVPAQQDKEGHDHEDEKKGNGEEKESPLEAFVHAHDNSEEATFFEQSIRAKLKAALTVMWDAELHLRLFDPAKSLPYQYQALKLLKEISNDSRIYVHRTGFDPPPVKEEKRLSGDLSEIKSSTGFYQDANTADYPSIRSALNVIGNLTQQKTIQLTPSTKIILQQAGNELSAIALEKPGTNLQLLSTLKRVIDDEVTERELRPVLLGIHQTLWRLLPSRPASPTRTDNNVNRWDNAFIKEMDALKE